MKKILLSLLMAGSLFAHGESKDPGMKLLGKRDYTGALKVFMKECDVDKNGWACGNAAIMYYKGFGTKADAIKAKEYDKKGCDLHDIASCENLGEILLVADKNKASAIYYLDKTCHMGKYAKNKLDKDAVNMACQRVKKLK